MNLFDFAVQETRRIYAAKQAEHNEMAIVCAWCDTVVKPGTLPATHTMCESCATKMYEALGDPRRV